MIIWGAMIQLPARYPYNPNIAVIFIASIPFAGGAAFFAYRAVHNDVGLIINNIITLDVTGATSFYWFMGALAALFVVAAIVTAIKRIANPTYFEIDDRGIKLPHGFLQKETAHIAFSEIVAAEEAEASGQTYLALSTKQSQYHLRQAWLPDRETYAAIRDYITSRGANKQ
jgi:hypothetical protein